MAFADNITTSHYNLPTTPADVFQAHLNVPDGAGRVNAGGSQPIEVRFIPIERGQRGAELAVLVLQPVEIPQHAGLQVREISIHSLRYMMARLRGDTCSFLQGMHACFLLSEIRADKARTLLRSLMRCVPFSLSCQMRR